MVLRKVQLDPGAERQERRAGCVSDCSGAPENAARSANVRGAEQHLADTRGVINIMEGLFPDNCFNSVKNTGRVTENLTSSENTAFIHLKNARGLVTYGQAQLL